MGYSEIPCKLCGVSFNIGRVRRADEPYRAGWSPLCGEPDALPESRNQGREWQNFISKDFVTWRRCDSSTACQDVKREVASTHTTSKASDDYSSDCDDDDDYMSESEEDDEPLDYTSDVASVKEPDMGDTEGFTSEPNDAPPNQLDMAVDEDGTRIDADDENAVNDEPMGAVEHLERRLSTDDHASDSGKSGSTDWNECQELEHLAGPRCEHASGYCGFNISAEEMRGCTTVQCLVVKTSEWTPEPDDQDFELTGKYFLSGLCGQMPSRDIGGPTMTPPRHGAEDIYPDTTFSKAYESVTPIPFHPTCFEIFARVSRLRTASIDVDGLMGWHILESDYATYRAFPRHEAVKKSREQWWYHQPGCEWLAANPVIVPGLAALLRLAVSANSDSPKDGAHGRTLLEDPFSKFPREIADTILELLSPVDVAALRLAGCARFLDIESWYRLLGEEMPWLWEVWDTALPSFWASTTVSALSAEKKRKKRKKKAEKQRLAARRDVEMERPELVENWDMDNAKELERSSAMCGNEPLEEVTVLPKDGTNWCRVYYEVKTNWDALKGLQNRERIWRDVEEIFRRIDVHGGEGRVD